VNYSLENSFAIIRQYQLICKKDYYFLIGTELNTVILD